MVKPRLRGMWKNAQRTLRLLCISNTFIFVKLVTKFTINPLPLSSYGEQSPERSSCASNKTSILLTIQLYDHICRKASRMKHTFRKECNVMYIRNKSCALWTQKPYMIMKHRKSYRTEQLALRNGILENVCIRHSAFVLTISDTRLADGNWNSRTS